MAEPLGRACPGAREVGHSDRYRQWNRLLCATLLRGRQDLANASCKFHRVTSIRTGGDDSKLIASEACREIAGSTGVPQAKGHLPERSIARLVTSSVVVDALQIIDV